MIGVNPNISVITININQSFKIRAFILHIKTLRHMLFIRDMPKMQRSKEAKDEKNERKYISINVPWI